MRWLDSVTDSMDMNLGKLGEIVRDKEAWLQSMGSQSQTRLSDGTTTTTKHPLLGPLKSWVSGTSLLECRGTGFNPWSGNYL